MMDVSSFSIFIPVVAVLLSALLAYAFNSALNERDKKIDNLQKICAKLCEAMSTHATEIAVLKNKAETHLSQLEKLDEKLEKWLDSE